MRGVAVDPSRLTAGNLELAFTLAFDLEMIIRAAAHFPDYRMFFARFRNDFDLFLAISTSIIQIPAISSSDAYPWLTILQLLRWYRVILAFPRMRPLVVGWCCAKFALRTDDGVW